LSQVVVLNPLKSTKSGGKVSLNVCPFIVISNSCDVPPVGVFVESFLQDPIESTIMPIKELSRIFFIFKYKK
jgi:hypothetical protein